MICYIYVLVDNLLYAHIHSHYIVGLANSMIVGQLYVVMILPLSIMILVDNTFLQLIGHISVTNMNIVISTSLAY